MGKRVGRILRLVGIVLVAALAIELLWLSPRLFSNRSAAEPASSDSVPSVAELPTVVPTQSPTPLVATPTRRPTKIPTPTLIVIATETPEPTPTEPAPTETPTPEADVADDEDAAIVIPTAEPQTGPEPTAIANAFSINSIIYQEQAGYFTHAGPATVASVLSYWGDKTTQHEVASVLHGSAERGDDRNVSPQELLTYIQENSDIEAMFRYGGTVDLLKQLVAAGFPVVIQNSFPLPGNVGWSGHYTIINGYNEARNTFLTYDPYVGPFQIYDIDQIEASWRPFNFAFIVLYPESRAGEALNVLRDYSWNEWALGQALQRSQREAADLTGLEQFHAQFNEGTTLMGYGDFRKAVTAYDKAFAMYDELADFEKPKRLLWYFDGPYEAYFRTERYQQVIDLADTTLSNVDSPVLEESFYWRGMASEAFNNPSQAASDLQLASELNPRLYAPDE